jgi:hypothetical protein
LTLASPAAITIPDGLLNNPNRDVEVLFQFFDGDGAVELRYVSDSSDPSLRIPDTAVEPVIVGPFPLVHAPKFVASVAGSTTVKITILEFVG